jgi:AraC-like DNA-binding protein/quercetin dioxygenase-like cupin family protein
MMSLPEHIGLRAALNWNEASSRISPTPGPFAREHLPFIQEIGYFETEPGYFTERNSLESYLLMVTVSGVGELDYRGQTWTIQEGDLVWIDCREPHAYRTDPNQLLKFYWVHWTGANSQGYYQMFEEIQNARPLLHLAEPTAAAAGLKTLLAQQQNRGSLAEFVTARLLVDLMTDVLQLAAMPPQTVREPVGFHPAVQAAIAAMERQLGEPVSLEDLARQGQVSRFHLIKLFTRQTGLTPMAYLHQVRISEAKRLLHQTDWKLDRIAEAVGLQPASYLIALFRRHEGMTPGEYRRMWLNRRSQA